MPNKKYLTILGVFLLFSGVARAQDPDASVTLFDFEPVASGTELIVAMQPHEAYEIVRTSAGQPLRLDQLRSSQDILAAFVEGRVTLRQSGTDCAWNAKTDPIPETLLDAYAEGVTVRGLVECPNANAAFTLETDLFTDRFSGHQNLARYFRGEAYETFATLTAEDRFTIVNPKLAASLSDVHIQSWKENAWLAALAVLLISGLLGLLWLKTKRASSRGLGAGA